jgi:hypothetical protein
MGGKICPRAPLFSFLLFSFNLERFVKISKEKNWLAARLNPTSASFFSPFIAALYGKKNFLISRARHYILMVQILLRFPAAALFFRRWVLQQTQCALSNWQLQSSPLGSNLISFSKYTSVISYFQMNTPHVYINTLSFWIRGAFTKENGNFLYSRHRFLWNCSRKPLSDGLFWYWFIHTQIQIITLDFICILLGSKGARPERTPTEVGGPSIKPPW